jgi:hypothetical protein
MRFKLILFCLVFIVACQEKTTQPVVENDDHYDNLLVDRTGNGDLEFGIFPTSLTDIFLSRVSRFNSRDTLIEFNIIEDSTNTILIETLRHTLHGHWELTGDFKQDTLSAATRVDLYMVHDGDRTEITNTDLRNVFLEFEPLVRKELEN